jgi:hypothetical protein
MNMPSTSRAAAPITDLISAIPYRLALAGGWIDQPFVSRLNPDAVGSMVVVSLQPTFRFMQRSGVATGTRECAIKLWNGVLPSRPPAQLVRELYAAENAGQPHPSGSQDMIGIVYPGVNRLDYDHRCEGGVFPSHIESLMDEDIRQWLERILHLLPVAPRPPGYSPLGERNLEPSTIARLGRSGRDCFEAIRKMDVVALGASMNECMSCWEELLPQTLRHPTLTVDLPRLARIYQSQYPGAMYSGCGGGYLIVASDLSVPGAFRVQIRTQ